MSQSWSVESSKSGDLLGQELTCLGLITLTGELANIKLLKLSMGSSRTLSGVKFGNCGTEVMLHLLNVGEIDQVCVILKQKKVFE